MGVNWRRVVGAKIGHMTPEDALTLLVKIRAEHIGPGQTIFHPTIRDLTGGFNSQSINNYVIRRLGIKAGIIKNQS